MSSAPTQLAGLNYTPATTDGEVYEAMSLVYRAYREIGIIPRNQAGIHTSSHLQTNRSLTVCGRIGPLCVSTISAYLDDPDHGLPLDKVYPEKLDKLRGDGASLLEVGLFADRRMADDKRSFGALLSLIGYAVYFGVHQNVTHAVIGVHPRHAPFYSRGLGFQYVGEEKSYSTLEDAPVVLMHLDWNAARTAGKPGRGVKHCLAHPTSAEWYAELFAKLDADPDAAFTRRIA